MDAKREEAEKLIRDLDRTVAVFTELKEALESDAAKEAMAEVFDEMIQQAKELKAQALVEGGLV